MSRTVIQKMAVCVQCETSREFFQLSNAVKEDDSICYLGKVGTLITEVTKVTEGSEPKPQCFPKPTQIVLVTKPNQVVILSKPNQTAAV